MLVSPSAVSREEQVSCRITQAGMRVETVWSKENQNQDWSAIFAGCGPVGSRVAVDSLGWAPYGCDMGAAGGADGPGESPQRS